MPERRSHLRLRTAKGISVKTAEQLQRMLLRLWSPSIHTAPLRGTSSKAVSLRLHDFGRAQALPLFFSAPLACAQTSRLTVGLSADPVVKREPIFNIPGVIAALCGVLVLIHGARVFLLNERQDTEVLLLFAFIPARYDSTAAILGNQWPGGVGSEVWTFVTYSFLHADWTHLLVNSIWLLPFGSAVARRFGVTRFLLFFAATSAAGALAQLAGDSGGRFVMIGASAAISGMMAAAMRFAFQRGGPLGFWRDGDEQAYRVPALPLAGVVRDPRVIGFVVVWFGVNLIFGIGSLSLGNGDQPIAWQAHVGGFLAGLLLFGLFDPAGRDALTAPDS